ncbi:MAG: cupin domain-containing protein, partial [Victivallaceae bacterium]
MDIIKWKIINAGSDATRIIRHRLNHSYSVKAHGHDFPEFFWVVSGEGIHQVNDNSIPVKTGDLIFMRSGDWHAVSAGSKGI